MAALQTSEVYPDAVREPERTSQSGEGRVILDGVSKVLGGAPVINQLDLEVDGGEFLTILGPSGVGKSTILNVISGFLPVDEGRVYVGGQDITYEPAHRRNIGFIFQEYALFPHLTVERNVQFPLDMRRIRGDAARPRVADALEMVGLSEYAKRRPRALSGGQRQRVAIARALVFRPEILLMDEPMSSLDRQLRDEMTVEIRRLQREVGVTVLYVTHDQTEALSLSDRVGILGDGKLEQIGSPQEVHDAPVSSYTARLTGAVNTLAVAGYQFSENDLARVDLEASDVTVRARVDHRGELPKDAGELVVGVRPHILTLQTELPEENRNAFKVTVTTLGLIGNGVRYEVDMGDGTLWQVISTRPFPGVEVGSASYLVWSYADTVLMRA